MRFLLSLIIWLSLVFSVSAQIKISNQEKEEIKQLVDDKVSKILGTTQQQPEIKPVKPRSIDDELAIILGDLGQYPSAERYNILYFTFYHIDDPELLKKFYLELTFWIHSLSSESFIKPPQAVTGSSTLFKVDLRDYGWTQDAWERVSTREAYIREPWIDHATYDAIRLDSGNNVIRGDWFLSHTSSPVKQIDIGDKEILYETLLYAQLGRSPKNIKEFYDYWGYDIKKLETKLYKVEQILVPHGKSGVARSNRILARVPTELGYLYSSSDFLNSTKEKNVIENLYPDIMLHPNRDAGEHIGTNKIGLQHYLVTDNKDNNVWVANERVAFDRTDTRDITVMAGKSCVICHSQGINIPYNGLLELLQKKVELRYADKQFKISADRTYFGPLSRVYDDPQRETLMEKDRQNFNDAVKDVNGLDGSTNARYFKEVLDWYEDDITLEQAAKECGVTIEEFQEKVLRTISGRLGELANGGTVSRQEWEELDNGYFAQSMLLLKGVNKTIIQNAYQNVEITKEAPTIETIGHIITTKKATLKVGDKILGYVPPNTTLDLIRSQGDWYWTEYKEGYNIINGYVHKSQVKLEE